MADDDGRLLGDGMGWIGGMGFEEIGVCVALHIVSQQIIQHIDITNKVFPSTHLLAGDIRTTTTILTLHPIPTQTRTRLKKSNLQSTTPCLTPSPSTFFFPRHTHTMTENPDRIRQRMAGDCWLRPGAIARTEGMEGHLGVSGRRSPRSGAVCLSGRRMSKLKTRHLEW